MARTSNVFARVEPEIKEQAEQVLDQLGKIDTIIANKYGISSCSIFR